MKSRVEAVDGSHSGEMNGVDDRIIEEREGEGAVAGPDEVKDSEEDEIFEGAAVPPMKSRPEYFVADEDGDSKEIYDLKSGGIDEILNVGHEGAIGVPGVVKNSEHAVEVEVEGVDGVVRVNNIDESISEEADELSEEDQGKVASNADMDGEIDPFRDYPVFDLQDTIDKPRRRKKHRRDLDDSTLETIKVYDKSPAHSTGLGSQVNATTSQIQALFSEDAEENDETHQKLQMIGVKFLRLAHRLGQTPDDDVVAQVLGRLVYAEQLRLRNRGWGSVGAFIFDGASAMAKQLEASGQEPLDFSCTIMVLGKTGVGKSATINSIFDDVKFRTDAFQFGTEKVQDVVGTVEGIKVRVIDTPGLLPYWSDQRQNEKILHSVKRFIKKTPPDVVLYLDRLDMQTRDLDDLLLLRTITKIFGPSIWFNAIVGFTHAASAPPDAPNGSASSYDKLVAQRCRVVQQAIRQAAGAMQLLNPVSLVENNHSACRTNWAGQRVLPNGQVWKSHLLLLSFASKIFAEANKLLNLKDSPLGKLFRLTSPSLPILLKSLLQSRPQVRLPEEKVGDNDTFDEDLDDFSDSDKELEFDELPPFKALTKAQLAELTKAWRAVYYEELEYREKLFTKKQLKEAKQRPKIMKKMASSSKDLPSKNAEEERGRACAASGQVTVPDLTLPASFDSGDRTHRYQYLDTSNQRLARPILETRGWDQDVGYEGINVERVFAIKGKIPVSLSGQVTKNKKDANLQMEIASSVKHGGGKATSIGFDMEKAGKGMSYTLRGETTFCKSRKNKATAGISVTAQGDAITAGLKLEDKLIVNKWIRLAMTGGAMTGRGYFAYSGSLEATLRDEDHSLGPLLSTLGLSVMDCHGDLAIRCNVHSQIRIGRLTNIIGRVNLNNKGEGQVSIRLNSSEQLHIALIGLLPLLRKLLGYRPQKDRLDDYEDY